ncbi:HD domain-containing protein [Amycolatopsis anabasis]|uniref:HD domain-containing protein n=1 Tax=Amycolatopsis anabasis TaxID=1840409 RepID=UPI00131EAB18|nr:HD domain-containing protein [Amycolatopsis anabasis]
MAYRSIAVAGTLGHDGVYRDPLWEQTLALTPLEQRLLRTPAVRRLQFIAHAGAAAATTIQSYSRLEHSLGLLVLTAHFAPDDHAARIAALLHDIGHLPLSHTFEGVAGLHHHDLGARRVRALAPLLAEHDVDARDVLAAESGARPSVLSAIPGGLKLDHLESLLRSGRTHGRLTEAPADTLAKLTADHRGVSTDPATARYVAALAVGEARYRFTPEGAIATGVARGLVARLLSEPGADPAEVAELTDDELWSLLLRHPSTAEQARLFRNDPLAWEFTTEHRDGFRYEIDRLYLDTPLVDGVPTGIPADLAAELPTLPWSCTLTLRQ